MATSLNQDDYLKTALRLPRNLHAKIQEAGLANGRSMNAEIVAKLEAAFDGSPEKVQALDFAKVINEYGDAVRQLVSQERDRKSMLATLGNILHIVASEMRKLHEKGRVDICAGIALLGQVMENGNFDEAVSEAIALHETYCEAVEDWVKMHNSEDPAYLPRDPAEGRNVRQTPIHQATSIEGAAPAPGKPKKK
jgi:hypothetical protein